jgi:hypothetical protein
MGFCVGQAPACAKAMFAIPSAIKTVKRALKQALMAIFGKSRMDYLLLIRPQYYHPQGLFAR